MTNSGRRSMGKAAMLGAAMVVTGADRAEASGGDLSRQTPVEVVVDLGTKDGQHVFAPNVLRFETGRLYKLVLRNPSPDPHYFTSDEFAASVWTRKVQVTQRRQDGQMETLAEFKGAIREIEVYPGHQAEWWLVPVQAGRFRDLRCGIRMPDGSTHADHGMRGEIIVG